MMFGEIKALFAPTPPISIDFLGLEASLALEIDKKKTVARSSQLIMGAVASA